MIKYILEIRKIGGDFKIRFDKKVAVLRDEGSNGDREMRPHFIL